jgi:hypothetical protein
MPRRFSALLLLLALSDGARMIAREASIIVLSSKQLNWTVGECDNELSRACALGQFGPLRMGALIARFTGAEGSALLEVAKGDGTQPAQSKRLAQRTEDYFLP